MVKNRHFKKIILKFITLIVIMFMVLRYPDINAADFYVTDSANGKSYSVTQNDSTLTVSSGSKNFKLNISDEVVNVLCCDYVMSFLCICENSSATYKYTIVTFDINSEDINTLATNIIASRSSLLFGTNNKGTYYILDHKDSTTLHIVSNSFTDTVNAKGTIYQILYISNGENLVFTSKGTYSLKDKDLSFVSSTTPAKPCSLTEKGIITDAKGNEYIYKNNILKAVEESADKQTSTTTNSSYAETPSVVISGNTVILPHKTTFAGLYKNLGITKSELKVYKTNGTAITSGILGTGMKAYFEGKSYEIMIYGELTGEGNINSRDLKALMKHLTGESYLTEPYLTAADINKDGQINTKDLLSLSRLY